MLRDIVANKHYKFAKEASSWQEAVRMSCEPLLADGTIEETYVKAIIDCITEYGPYIIIVPNVAMPHSQLSAEGVNKTSISFMRLEKPVSFDENDSEKDASLFFTIASCNPDEHMGNIMKLTEILSNEELLLELAKAETPEDLIRLQEKYLDNK